MKRNSLSLVVGIAALWASAAIAAPMGLGDFRVSPPESAGFVSVTGSSFTIDEDPSTAFVSLSNDVFQVGPLAESLSFGYALTLDGADPSDTFAFFVGGAEALRVDATTATSGTFSLDLTPYRNSTVSLEWQLAWGGDPNDPALSRLEVSNVDLQTAATPVPVPGTLVLLGSGLLGLVCWARRRKA